MSVKNEKPILFSTPMVQAILEGRKTMTRRIVKDKFLIQGNPKFSTRNSELTGVCPYGKVGDVLWVREKFFKHNEHEIWYAAENFPRIIDTDYVKWKPSIHMPKAAARIWLEITNIRVERLWEISDEDAKAEGVKPKEGMWFKRIQRYDEAFSELWQSINGEQSWNENPWVWVVEFKKIKR
jgi:hypothetical protein